MAVVTPSDRPKSFHNRCVIDVFVVFLCCHFAVWSGGSKGFFFQKTESDLFLFSFNKSSIRIQFSDNCKIISAYSCSRIQNAVEDSKVEMPLTC